MTATDPGMRRVDAEPPTAAAPVPPSRFTRPWPFVTARPRPAAQGLLAFAIYLAVFILAGGMPLIRHLNVPNLRQYWTDVQFYAWALGWWPYAVSHGINPLFSSQIGAPHGYDLAWASTAPSVDLAMWPVTAAFGVLVSYNLALLLIPPLSGWAAFIAARRLTGRFWASLLAGAVYGFCPYELVHTWQGQPNLTVIALFPLLVYLVVRWWEGSLGRTWFVAWMALAMALQFYTFNEAFFEMTAVGAGALVIGFATAGRAQWPKLARLTGWTAAAYAGAVGLSAPYLIYSLRHFAGGTLTRQQPAYSLPLIRLIVPTSQQSFGVTPLIRYSNHIGRVGIENYVCLPLIVILLVMAALAWKNRLYRLLALGFVFVIALAVGPNLVVTSVHHTYPLPWAGLWNLPLARSAEPSRFIVFAVLALALALALWLAKNNTSKLWQAARWAVGLLAVAVILTDSPTSYQAVQPVPAGWQLGVHPENRLPAFVTGGLYRQYLKPGEIVVILTGRGNAGMLFQAASDFYYRIAGGYINASLTPVNALPHPVTLLARPSKAAVAMFDDYARSSGLGAIVVEQAWEEPWMNLSRLGMRGKSVGGVTIYPMGPWLADQAHSCPCPG
ncbi:MAG: ArnT family glycosyltransferase [Streptosporangiaceae bacterium]